MDIRRFRKMCVYALSLSVAFVGLFVSPPAPAQQPCANGIRIDGAVTDPSGAVISGANVRSAGGQKAVTDEAGRFVLACVAGTSTTLRSQAAGFAESTQRVRARPGETVHINLQLIIASARTDIQVNADTPDVESDNSAGSATLSAAEVQRLPDDPDEFLRELQLLASAGGGDPSSAVVTIDGFQNTGALPPKSSIASVRVNPDLFSAEHQWPPFGGGAIEIVTKPGASSPHGALFFTDSNGVFNATDPFSVTATPAGKQRYGFELSGPLVRQKSGFSLALEKRDIDEFNVVDATTLDADGAPEPVQQAVTAPQRLWIASARGDWQATPTDIATLSYSANVNNLGNQGVGGLVLADAGYSSLASEYDLRFTNTFTPNANLLHETRIGYSWKRTGQTPNSTTAALEVAGFFSCGGSAGQNLDDRERDLEVDDDVMLTRGRHTYKFGVQSLGYFVHDYDPENFNGAYVFGGGSAPALDAQNNPTGQTITITGLEQYRRAELNLPGGAPTTYQVTSAISGSPLVLFTQWQLGLFANYSVKLLPQLTMDAGFRYQLQTSPESFGNFAPRMGFAWALDKKQTWIIHLRGGFFPRAATDLASDAEVYRLNGVRQKSTLIYGPDYNNPLTPIPGSIQINTVNEFPRSFSQMSTFIAYLNVEHEFPQHWHAKVNFFSGEDWRSLRIVNINAPMVASSIGSAPNPSAALLAPRPIAPNENILQYQNSGHLLGNLVSFNLDQHGYKHLGLSMRYAHQNFKANVVGNGLNSPQSTYSSNGESARVEWSKNNYVSLTGNLILPGEVELDTQFDAGDGSHYSVTTGTDNNGDGNFNDRPAYASAPGPGVYSTKFGLLTNDTVNGDVPRNIGIMPGPIHLNLNLSRAFILNPTDKDRPRTITLNARSSNLLNHTNVTAVNSILASSNVGQPVAAESARRVEVGVRFSF